MAPRAWPPERLRRWFGGHASPLPTRYAKRAVTTHVVLLDGTMSQLTHGQETNIGLTYQLLREVSAKAHLSIHYAPGVQWQSWRHTHEVIVGIGLNRQIQRAYLHLARHYRPGDRVMLMGYSRGAHAVRALAGMIDKMGLLRPAHLDPTTRRRLYTLYRTEPDGAAARAMKASLCHPPCPIAFLGAYDTVCTRNMHTPLIWRLLPTPHSFHDDRLGQGIQMARQALALEETRVAYHPLIWKSDPGDAASGRVQQMWFRGSHGDVGGQLGGLGWARPLANIPLVWMLSEAETAGLALPLHWRNRFVTDAGAQGIGMNRGVGLFFVLRRQRPLGQDPSEMVHPSAMMAAKMYGFPARSAHPA